jgi:hypothetical protein
MTITIRRALAATAVAVLAAVGVPAGASAASPAASGPILATTSTAARSVVVVVFNDSDCKFVFSSATLWHGIWATPVPGAINPHTTVSWRTDSNGFMTGVEGEISYVPAAGCAKQPPSFTVYWDDPYVGSNSYFWEFNSPNPYGWKMTMSGGGGSNATITFHLFV